MRILQVNYEYPPLGGGGGVAMMEVARQLARRHTVHVLTSGARGLPKVEKDPDPDLDLTIFRTPVLWRSKKAVASMPSMLSFYPSGIRLGKRLAAEHGYDVINTWFAIPSGPTGTRLARRFGIPHLLTIIGGDIYDPSKWYSPHRNRLVGSVVRSVIRQADRHTAISQDIARRAREYYGAESPIEVIPLGITPPVFPEASRAEIGLDEDTRYIATIGRMVRRKDYPTLIRAVSMLERQDAHLIVMGDGPQRENCQKLAASLGIADRVHFKGFVPQDLKYQLLANADLFALTSLHEGFGLVYLEAMHCGLPVIASDCGGQRDFLEDEKTGYVIPTGDARALSEALAKVLHDTESAKAMGAANREIAAAFTHVHTAERYEALLEETIGSRDRAVPLTTS